MSTLKSDLDLQKSFPENVMAGGYLRLFAESQPFIDDVAKKICEDSSPEADLLYLHAMSRSDSGLLNDLLHELINSDCITTGVAVQYLDEQSRYRMTEDYLVLADGFIHELDDYETSTSEVDLLFGNYDNFTEALRSIADGGDEMAYLQYHNHWQFIAMLVNANKATVQSFCNRVLGDDDLAEHVKHPIGNLRLEGSQKASSVVFIF